MEIMCQIFAESVSILQKMSPTADAVEIIPKRYTSAAKYHLDWAI